MSLDDAWKIAELQQQLAVAQTELANSESIRRAEKDILIAEIAAHKATKQKLVDLEAGFDLRWNADMRAIKMWQKATGRTLVWPDHTDLCTWLLEQLAAVISMLEART